MGNSQICSSGLVYGHTYGIDIHITFDYGHTYTYGIWSIQWFTMYNRRIILIRYAYHVFLK